MTISAKFLPGRYGEMARQLLGKHSTRLAAGVEQIIYGVVSMVTLMILSRVMDKPEFGTFATAVGIWLAAEILQLVAIINPMIISCPDPETHPREMGAWIMFNSLTATVIGLLLYASSWVAEPFSESLSTALAMVGPIVFGGMHFMFVRRIHYHRNDHRLLLLQIGVYALVSFALLGALLSAHITLTARIAAGVFAMGLFVPVLFVAPAILSRASFAVDSWRCIVSSRKLISQTAVAGALWPAFNSASIVGLNMLAGPAAVAVFSATRTLSRPVSLMITTIASVDASRASKGWNAQGLKGIVPVARSTWRGLALVTAVPMAIALLIPGFLLELVYGHQYAGETVELRLWIVFLAIMVCAVPMETFLNVTRNTGRLIRINAIGVVIAVAFLAGQAAVGEISATSVLVSMIAGKLLALPLLFGQFKTLSTVREAEVPPQRVLEASHEG